MLQHGMVTGRGPDSLHALDGHRSRAPDRIFDSEVWTVSPDGSNPIMVFDQNGCDMGDERDALPVWAPNGTQVAYNGCGTWVVANADGTGEAQQIDEAVYRSWAGGGLATGWNVH